VELWTPGKATDKVAVNPTVQKVVPEIGKAEGGSYFDDEMDDRSRLEARIEQDAADLRAHINARPDHVVYVSSVEDRAKMRAAFNVWHRHGLLNHNPTIKIEYGVVEGGIRVAE
jgi:hypothetical protein